MENDGGSGTIGSHLESTALGDILMAGAASRTEAKLSPITIAMMKDTNFYAWVNDDMAENI